MVIRFTAFLFLLLAGPLLAGYNSTYQPVLFRLYDSVIEKQLVKEVAAERLTTFTLLEAGLISSGAITKTALDSYSRRYEAAFRNIRAAMQQQPHATQYARARTVLRLLFHHLFGRYHSRRTTLLDVLRFRTYNCVSSSLLYNLTATRLGLRTRAIVVPGHVYSQVLIGGEWIDVETTVNQGFHPVRNQQQSVPAGRAYIKDQGKGKQQIIISNLKLTALIFYNRGTLYYKHNRLRQATRAFLKALRILPEHFESSENLMAALIQWTRNRIDQGNTKGALALCSEGERALGKRREFDLLAKNAYYKAANEAAAAGRFAQSIAFLRALVHKVPRYKQEASRNIQGYYANWAQLLFKQGKYKAMMQLMDKACSRWPGRFLTTFRIYLVTEASKKLFFTHSPRDGYAFFNRHLPPRNEDDMTRSNRQFFLEQWGKYMLRRGNYRQAYYVYRLALETYPGNRAFRLNCSVALEKWLLRLRRIHSPAALVPRLLSLYHRHEEQAILKLLAAQALQLARTLEADSRYQEAHQMLQSVSQLGDRSLLGPLQDAHLALLVHWGKKETAAKNHAHSISIFRTALRLYPGQDAATIQEHLRAAYYNHGVNLINAKHYPEARKVVTEALALFPRDKNLLRLKKYLAE